ncbi:MAG TPA: metal ABC transporter substrate-binding protein [Kofleriaceae bacterium]|nr:metal ABC transporter substrate-binding protein [Kofleriaceae bacterium]
MKPLPITAAALLALAAITAGAAPARAQAKQRIACTLPTIEAIVREVGGDKVEAFSLATGDQDPHFVSPTPSLMARVRNADMLFEIGMQLELWADQVADGSGNSRIFRTGAGRIVLSAGIPKLEVPTMLSHAQGDIHPEGNPHLWLDPVRAKLMADNAARALKAAAPADAAYFDTRLKDFKKRIDRAMFGDQLLDIVGTRKLSRLALDGKLVQFLDANEYQGKKLSELAGGWLAKARPLRGQKVYEFHKVWAYAASTFGFQLIGTIEEKPGIAPGPRHVRDTIDRVKSNGVKLILVDNFYDPALPQRIAREGGAKAVILPNQVRGEKGVNDYFALVDHVLTDMVAAVAP